MVPRIIDFGPEAKAAWVAFYDLIEAAMAEDGSLECLRDVAGKAAENAARIAAILTITEKPDATIIEVGAMTAGCELMAWYVAEALRLAGTHRLPLRTRNAIKLLDWLHSKGKAEIRIRELMQLAPRVEGFLWLSGRGARFVTRNERTIMRNGAEGV